MGWNELRSIFKASLVHKPSPVRLYTYTIYISSVQNTTLFSEELAVASARPEARGFKVH
jgi:hypothetical protein